MTPAEALTKVKAEDYREIRPILRTGDILLFSGHGWISKIIRRRTDCEFSHIATIIRLRTPDFVLVAESNMMGGVRLVRLSHYITRVRDGRIGYRGAIVLARHKAYAAPPAGFGEFDMAVLSQLGRAYGWATLLRIPLSSLATGISNLGIVQRARKRNVEFTCSEFVAHCFRKIGLEPKQIHAYSSPKDFAMDENVEGLARLHTGNLGSA